VVEAAVISSVSLISAEPPRLAVTVDDARSLAAGGRSIADTSFWSRLAGVYAVIYSMFQILLRAR
jgi:hypothetical protein